ncbi:transcriptional regulator, partial [Falsihalocynthiibacter sp. S25ZX9]
MSLWEYANPRKFMATSGTILPWVMALAVVTLVGGLVWWFFFTPEDYRQGATVKIMFLHVPAAL